MRYRLLLIGSLLLAGCAPTHQAPVGIPVHRGTYAYVCSGDGKCDVAVVDSAALKQALAEMGCGRDAVCSVEHAGMFYVVELND